MYCPECGTAVSPEDFLYGGCCGAQCSRCNFTMDCYDVFTKEYVEKTRPVRNRIKAALLRMSYDKRGK